MGCRGETVASVRCELEQTAEIRQFDRKGGRGVTSGTPDSQPSRIVPKETEEALTQEARRRLEASEPTDFRGLAKQYGVGEAYVQQRIAVAKALIQQAEQQAERSAQPETLAPGPSLPTPRRTGARLNPANLMQRIGRLLKRWESDADDPASELEELEELEALQRDIAERIKALRQ
jgi:hypothetical protein